MADPRVGTVSRAEVASSPAEVASSRAETASPRVAIVVYGNLDTRSGGFLYDRTLADHLDAAGWDVDVVSLPERRYAPATITNLSSSLVRRLEACDVVVEDAYCHPSLFFVNRRVGDTPVVALVHYLRSKEPRGRWRARAVRALEREYLGTVDGYVFNSRATRDSVAGLLGGSADDLRGIVAPPGGDRLGSGGPIPEERLRRDPFRVVSVCNVTPRKGVTTLIEGLSRLDVDWRLHVVGDVTVDPDHVEAARELARNLGVDDAVRFLGRVDDDRLRQELRAGHVLAVPSRYEPFGIVYLEGMAFGLPAIASARGGAEDVVNADNGALVPPNDPGGVAEAIAPLARDRELLERTSRNARATFRAQPTWEESCARIRRFLDGPIRTGTARNQR